MLVQKAATQDQSMVQLLKNIEFLSKSLVSDVEIQGYTARRAECITICCGESFGGGGHLMFIIGNELG